MKRLGVMIKSLRQETKLNQTVLAYGISSIPEISRIENGEKEPDSFLINALVQRMGKNLDEFRFVTSGSEYQIIQLRAQIQTAMLQHDMDTAEQCLEQYETYAESKKNLHKQYVLMVGAAIRYVKSKDHTGCMEMLREAVPLSIFDISDTKNMFYGWSLQETHLLLFYSLLLLEEGNVAEAVALLEQLVEYIEKRYTSEELKNNSFPGACYLLAKAYLLRGEKKRSYELCEKGVEYARKTGSIAFLMEFFELQQECNHSPVTEQRLEALRCFKRHAGYQEREETVIALLFHESLCSVIFSGEVVKEAREAHGWSQEQLSKDICARETVAYIEKGRRPKNQKLSIILKKMGMERRKYFCYVAAEDFSTYELQQQCIRNLFKGNKIVAGKLLGKLEKTLDVTLQFNRQFLQSSQIIYRILCGAISNKEAVRQLENCLRSTMPDYDGKVQRIPYPEEVLILNWLAHCLLQMEKGPEALELYESIRQQYLECSQKTAGQLEAQLYLYCSYIEVLGKYGYWKEAVQYGKEAVRLALQGQRGYLAVQLAKKVEEVLELCYTDEEKEKIKKYSEYITCLIDFYHG